MNLLELAKQSGLNPKWKASTAGGEYHSSCPLCGGIDRFYMQPYRTMQKCKGFYRCRQCGITGDAIQFARQFLNLTFQEAAKTVDATISELTISSTLKEPHVYSVVILSEPPTQWTKNITEFVDQAHKQLLFKQDILNHLATRGIPIHVIHQYKLGWSAKDLFYSRSELGLKDQFSDNGILRKIWIPKGLVIPICKITGQVIRLKIRRCGWKNTDNLPKYIAIPGSMNGLSLIGNTQHDVMIVVESELHAYAIEYATRDFAFAVAVGSNIKNPDNVTNRLAKKVKTLLICHDNDEAGSKMCVKWHNLYSHAKSYPTPIGKDVGEAIQLGFDIRNWLLQAVK